jgi:tetratricopeptide (TPR) repeat protein
MLKDLHAKEPDEQRYFNLLMDYYTRANDLKAMKAWAQEEIGINAGNKMAWALVGEVQMNDREWDAAVESYKKAIEIDPEFVQCVFNAGVCLSTKAIDLKDQLADKQTGKLTNANADKVKAILAEAKTFMERVQELDPGQSKVKWLYPLYQIYYNLGDSRAADLEKQLGNN